MYNVLKAFHVISVTMLAAGIGVESVIGPMQGAASSLRDLKVFTRVSVAAEKFLLIPAIFLVPIFGYATAGKGHWSLGMTWLVLGQVFFYTAVVIGLGFLARASFDLERTVRDMGDGPIPDDLKAKLKNPLFPIAGAINTVLFVSIIVVMVTKPGY